mgnify:CR=1 FL=1
MPCGNRTRVERRTPLWASGGLLRGCLRRHASRRARVSARRFQRGEFEPSRRARGRNVGVGEGACQARPSRRVRGRNRARRPTRVPTVRAAVRRPGANRRRRRGQRSRGRMRAGAGKPAARSRRARTARTHARGGGVFACCEPLKRRGRKPRRNVSKPHGYG